MRDKNVLAPLNPATDLLSTTAHQTYATILADPPWQFINRTAKSPQNTVA